jgi:hypothetical protein
MVDYLYSHPLKLLGVICFITYDFSSLDSLKVLYTTRTVFRSKFEYASVVCITLLQQILINWKTKRKFANLYCNRFIQPNSSCYFVSMLSNLLFKKLYSRRKFSTLYFLFTFSITKLTVVLLRILYGLLVPTKQIGYFFTFNVSNVSRLSPSTRCVTVANICRSLDVFSKHKFSFEDTLSFYLILLNYFTIVLPVLFYYLVLNYSPVLVLVLALV